MLEEVAELLRGGSGATLSARLAAVERRLGALEGGGEAAGGDVIAPSVSSTVPPGGAVNEVVVWKALGQGQWALLTNANIAPGAKIAESKLELPEVVKLTGSQTISGEKTFTVSQSFTEVKAETITLRGLKQINGAATLELRGGTFSLSEEETRLGPIAVAILRQLKITGKNENYEGFVTAPTDIAYAVIPEGGAAELTSIVSGGNKHRLICLVNTTTTETLTLVHEGAATVATSKMRFASGENVKLGPGQVLWLWYTEGSAAGTVERWRDVAAGSLNLRAPQATIGEATKSEIAELQTKLNEVIKSIKAWKIIA